MKSIISKIRAALMLAVLACSTMFSTSAFAADLPLNFNTSDNRNIQIENIVSFAKNTLNGTVDVLQVNGSTQTFMDAGHTTYAKMKAAALASGFYVQIPGQERMIHTRKHTEVKCSGSNTLIGYGFMNNALSFADGCALHAIFMASSNPH